MARPRVFADAAYVGCLVDGSMAQDLRRISVRDKIKASDFIRSALSAAISADMTDKLKERLGDTR